MTLDLRQVDEGELSSLSQGLRLPEPFRRRAMTTQVEARE